MTAAELFTFQFSAENFQRKEILASTIYGRGGNENFQFKFQSDRLSCALCLCFRSGHLGHWDWAPNIELRLDWIFIQMDNICKFTQLLPNLRRIQKLGKCCNELLSNLSPAFMSRLYLSLENEWSNLRYVINYFIFSWTISSFSSRCPPIAINPSPTMSITVEDLFAESWINICR